MGLILALKEEEEKDFEEHVHKRLQELEDSNLLLLKDLKEFKSLLEELSLIAKENKELCSVELKPVKKNNNSFSFRGLFGFLRGKKIE